MIQIFRMIISLCITFGIIFFVTEKKKRIVPVCIIYYFINVLHDIFTNGSEIELANAFGVSYQFGDTLLLIMLGVIVFSIKGTYVKINFHKIIIGGLFIILFIQTLVGFNKYGTSAELIGDVRTIYLFMVSIIYFVRYFKIEYIQPYRVLIDRVMIGILSLSIVIWVLDIVFNFHPLFSQYNAMLSDGGSTMRFIQPYQVLGIVLYTLALTRESIQKKGYIEAKALVFIIAVVLFQHRSIWMSLFVGIVFIILQECKTRKNTLKVLGQVFIISMICISILIFSNSSIVENIINSIDLLGRMISGKSIENTTAATRINVWEAVINDLTGLSIVFGRPFGYGYASSIGWETSPHSGYIRILGRTGYVGVSIIILLLLHIFNNFRRDRIIFGAEFILAIVAFMYSYDCTWLCGVIIGGCISYMYSRKNKQLPKNINYIGDL